MFQYQALSIRHEISRAHFGYVKKFAQKLYVRITYGS